jgi:hypothetical protein
MYRQSVARITTQADVAHNEVGRSKSAHLKKVSARLLRMRVAY